MEAGGEVGEVVMRGAVRECQNLVMRGVMTLGADTRTEPTRGRREVGTILEYWSVKGGKDDISHLSVMNSTW